MVSQIDGAPAVVASDVPAGSTLRLQRIVGGTGSAPFPVYEGLAESLASAHEGPHLDRDPTVAHVLGTCAGYAYADIATVATMMTRLGLERHACVRIAQRVDAMFISSTAYLVQSRCGRVVILCYRGTEPTTFPNWLAEGEAGARSSFLTLADGTTRLRVHAGFHLNVRATYVDVVRELAAAVDGRSLADHERPVDHGLEALYVTGHSLGGAMALLFALTIAGNSAHHALASRLRAVYTFGQPMAVEPPRGLVPGLESRVFRHLTARDPVPAFPPLTWGRFTHIGREYRYEGGEWCRSDAPVEQMPRAGGIPRSILNWLGPEPRRVSPQWSFGDHGPHHYLDALRPVGRVTEFGE